MTLKIKQATTLRHIPRDNVYNILSHNLTIKTESGWKDGCSYQCMSSGKVYVRPYEFFREDDWEYWIVHF